MNGSKEEQQSGSVQKVKFHFLKSTYFRVIHADGFFGGLSPQGGFHIGVYSERTPYPDLIIQEINTETGHPGKELSRTGSEGIIRELEVDIAMDLPTAITLHAWLGRHIKRAQESGLLKDWEVDSTNAE